MSNSAAGQLAPPPASRLELLPATFAICRLPPTEEPPVGSPATTFLSVTRTRGECSLVVEVEHVPQNADCQRDFRALRVVGPLSFDAVGILAHLTAVLADTQIPVFVVSTYDTDYVLLKQPHLAAAQAALTNAGYEIRDAN